MKSDEARQARRPNPGAPDGGCLPAQLRKRVWLGPAVAVLLTASGLGAQARPGNGVADTAASPPAGPHLPVPAQEEVSDTTRSWSLMPYAYYTPETGVAVGLLGAMVQGAPGSSRVQRSFRTSGEYTFKDQRTVWARYEAQPTSEWIRTLEGTGMIAVKNRFYAPGNRAGREAYEEWTRGGVEARAQLLRQLWHPTFFLGPALEVSRVVLREVEEGGLLGGGGVRGAEDHTLLGLGVAAILDSRDSQIYPREGRFHALSFTGYHATGGFEGDAVRLEMDLRRYRRLGGSRVLALRSRVVSSWGSVPFTLNAPIGGTGGGLRGLYGTRYMDRAAALVVAELRFHLLWRIGGVAFGGVGQVAPELSRLSLEGVHGTAGGGLRFAFMPASGLNLGVDFAMGEGESGLYFLLGEVF